MSKYQTYAEKLKDPRWQRKRLEIMGRDGFKCRHCHSSTDTLNVHHKLYRKGKMPWDYEDRVFVTLCEDCHNRAEKSKEAVLMNMGVCNRLDSRLLAISSAMGSDPGRFGMWGWALEFISDCIFADASLELNASLDTDERIQSVRNSSLEAIECIVEAMNKASMASEIPKRKSFDEMIKSAPEK